MSKHDPYPSIDATAEIWNMVTAAAHAAEIPAAMAFSEEHVSYIDRYGGNCRDCADYRGICPNRGLPCADSRKAIRFVLDALAYGLSHGFIVAPGALSPLNPQGFKWVPIEPTGVMKDQGAGSLPLSAAKPWAAGDCYRAMVAAAPDMKGGA